MSYIVYFYLTELKRLLPTLTRKDKAPRARTSWYAECGSDTSTQTSNTSWWVYLSYRIVSWNEQFFYIYYYSGSRKRLSILTKFHPAIIGRKKNTCFRIIMFFIHKTAHACRHMQTSSWYPVSWFIILISWLILVNTTLWHATFPIILTHNVQILITFYLQPDQSFKWQTWWTMVLINKLWFSNFYG